ncbi:aldehyde dehydrogenase family protein [Vulgatibacter incomptus]|uniref:Aldehyde dehydrogenase n=1 Tax=Vulgatibacter incomptus TaxID=1391653 RepID=A0A0K1PHA0_9BACT|nr:aldehyde dehydrogenase family protein [Vulgatibacter incomptus]AKU92499.1 Aldehyde dehydrogenase [Vulgatibacter incomptus]
MPTAPGAAPTVPLDPPTAYGLAALFVLLGTKLVRAGRGRAAFRVAMLFVVVFAISVQYFLFSWPAWMYAYLLPESQLSLVWVSPVFFVSVVAAGAAGAAVSLHLVRTGKMGWAIANVVLGLGAWILIWLVTWDQYFHVGTYETYHAGLAPPVKDVAPFQTALNVVGPIQAIVGLGCLAWILVKGKRAKLASCVQPDPSKVEWRSVGSEPGAASTPVIEGGFIRGVRPIDGAPLEPLAITPAGELAGIVSRARDAQHEWALRPVKERAALLRKAGKRLLERAEEAAAILEEENGRPRAESYLSEIVPCADLFDYWCSKGPLLLQADGVPVNPVLFPGKSGVVEHLPRGVVAAISPWNFPLMLPLRTVVPALLAGNAVILKPSEHAARSGAFLARIFDGILPPGLFALVQGGGEQGSALVGAGVDHLVFIGSPRTGRAVARACAEKLTSVTLELGGKDAAIVLADADLERTANGVVWGAFANAGQNCAAIERCYVVESVADRFEVLLREKVAALRVGPGPEGSVEIGPLTTPAQKAIVDAQLDEARRRSVSVAGGESGEKGLHLAPTLVLGPPDDLALVAQETFGPVLPVVRVRDEEDAVKRANASAYGLTVSVWSKDTDRAERLGRRIHAGVITVNNHAFTGGLAQAPWGGVRGSGFGVTNSPHMLDELTRPRFVLVDRSRAKRELWWYPYDASVLRLARGLTQLRSGAGGRLAALGEVVAGFLARGKVVRSGASAPQSEGKRGAPQ